MWRELNGKTALVVGGEVICYIERREDLYYIAYENTLRLWNTAYGYPGETEAKTAVVDAFGRWLHLAMKELPSLSPPEPT
jgi:hypothetical protein